MREGIKDEEEEWKMETLEVELTDDELKLSSLLLKEHLHYILKEDEYGRDWVTVADIPCSTRCII